MDFSFLEALLGSESSLDPIFDKFHLSTAKIKENAEMKFSDRL